MAVVPQNYTLKAGDLEVVKFEGDMTEMQDIATWVQDTLELLGDFNVSLNTMMGVSLSFSYLFNGTPRSGLVRPGDYLIKDSGGFVYGMTADELNAHYVLVP